MPQAAVALSGSDKRAMSARDALLPTSSELAKPSLRREEGGCLTFVDCMCVPRPPYLRALARAARDAPVRRRRYTVKVAAPGQKLPPPLGRGVEKTLITECSASVRAGEVLAVMGPSGAGKTTLLNVLTLERFGGVPTGTVTLNGRPFTAAAYREHAAFVPQTDQLWAFLTAREHVEYAVALYQPSLDATARAVMVEELLAETGLTGCQDTKAGNELLKGLSGGQRRRLSLAVALSKKPHVVFLDEPTSGLDAAAASSIMAFLKETAARTHIAVVCTIHQPSTSVFDGFDSVCFLTGGRMAYLDKASALPGYLASVGKPLPANANPADFMLDLINKDFSDPQTVDFMLGEWARRAPRVEVPAPSALEPPPAVPFGTQLRFLLHRHAKLVVRDPTLYLARAGIYVACTLFLSILYVKARELQQDQVLPRLFFTMFLLALPGLFALVTVFHANLEIKAVKRECKENMYSSSAYLLVRVLLQIPVMFFLSFWALVPAAYGVLAAPWEGFGKMLFVFAWQLWAFECFAQFFALIPNPLLGVMQFMNLWFVAFLFNGIAIPVHDVIWPFRIFTWVLPYRWAQPAVTGLFFTYSSGFSGAEPCTPGAAGCISGPDGDGYRCPDTAAAGCYGYTGSQVLSSIGKTFPSVTDQVEEVYAGYAGLCAAIALFFLLVFFVQLTQLCAESEEPKPPETRLKGERGPTARVGPASSQVNAQVSEEHHNSENV
jgi:ABC-type multidrug transport system ATPase subunit